MQWLQNSDSDCHCYFCKQPLEQSPTVRLTCLDVFHEKCIINYGEKLAESHAPAADYPCPICRTPILAKKSVTGKIAETLYASAQNWPWAPKTGSRKLSASDGVKPSTQTVLEFQDSASIPSRWDNSPAPSSLPKRNSSIYSTSDLINQKDKGPLLAKRASSVHLGRPGVAVKDVLKGLIASRKIRKYLVFLLVLLLCVYLLYLLLLDSETDSLTLNTTLPSTVGADDAELDAS